MLRQKAPKISKRAPSHDGRLEPESAMNETDSATKVFRAIHEGLQATEKTREPMNALILWTELGRGLAGKLERQGADRGLLQRLVVGYCNNAPDTAPVDP